MGFAAQPCESLGHLAADRAGPDDAQPPGNARKRKNRLIRQESRCREARNCRPGRSRSRCDEGPGEFEPVAVDLGFGLTGKASLAEKNIDSKVLKTARGIMARDVRPQPAH